MELRKKLSLLFLFFVFYGFSQSFQYSSFLLSQELKEHSNAIIRKNDVQIDILSFDKMEYSLHRIVTVLNKEGERNIKAFVHYNSSYQIKKLEAKIYNQLGEQIKKIKKGDFLDQSAVSGGTLYSDNRVKYLDYTPISYPYTVEFTVEYVSKNTAGLPKWSPLESYFSSTEESKITINYAADVGVHFKEENFQDFSIENNSTDGKLEYVATNIPAIKYEVYSPSFSKIAPRLKVAVNHFYHEGYSGKNDSWENMGRKMYNELISNRLTVSQSTKGEILHKTANAKTDLEKAKIVYQYVQDKTRYISVQEGIGGIQPISAKEVDDVKYGDCKGLTNYTKALLDIVGVKANYTRVYASSRNTTDIDKDFVSFVGQTNHVILHLPIDGKDVWLECTSQTSPFNYSANFTDDRDVFVLSPEGGKIVHTKVYTEEENLQNTKAIVEIDRSGGFSSTITINAQGTQYGYREGVQDEILKDQKLHYKDNWDYINDLEIESMEFNNDKDSIVFTENLKLSSVNYASLTSGLFLFEPNLFNRHTYVPPRYKDRKLPFQIYRGYTDVDEYEITIPEEFKVESLKEPVSITNKFGEYNYSIEQIAPNKLVFKRKLVINKGEYTKEEYKAYRDFIRKVVRHDKSKIALKQTI